MKTLQPTELDKIRQELINQKVEYIEVIEELTDHIANGIEQQWSEYNNNINFEEALTIELNKFGAKGLKKVQSFIVKSKGLEYTRKLFEAIKDCFTSIKLLLFIAIALSSYTLLVSTEESPVLASLSKIAVIIPIIFCLSAIILELARASQKHYYMNSFKKSIYSSSYNNLISICIYISIPINLTYNINSTNYYSLLDISINLTYLFKSSYLTLVLLINYCILFTLKSQFQQDIKNTTSKICN